MSFDEDFKLRQGMVEEGFLNLVVSSYEHFFHNLGGKALDHMSSNGLEKVAIQGVRNFRQGLFFSEDGEFYDGKAKLVHLREMPKFYQDYSDYIAGCADSRSHKTPSVHSAMRSAVEDFRKTVKKLLVSEI